MFRKILTKKLVIRTQLISLILANLPFVTLASDQTCLEKSTTIEGKLSCLSGVQFEEVASKIEGYRVFTVFFNQPIDHLNPSAGTFSQKLILEHKAFDRPMVLQTSGYSIFGTALTGLAKQFVTNQIQVEHRYFNVSIPKNADWTKLNIWQSANDFHRITQSLKQLYTGGWVNTGASKGGMTSLFYRRFFPDDLDGTVADVAPISLAIEDPRYIPFMDNVGGIKYADCREKLESMRIELLQNRDLVKKKVTGSFKLSGGIDSAIEDALEFLPWAFWQYHGVLECDKVLGFKTLDEKMKYMLTINAPSEDDDINAVKPYYYQALTELGHQGLDLSELIKLGLDQYQFGLSEIFPESKFGKLNYSNSAILDVLQWLRDESSSMMFVYGQFDPWTAAQIDVRENSDSYKYIVENGNHGSKYYLLNAADRSEAVSTLMRWFHLDSMQPFSVEQSGRNDFDFDGTTDFSDTLDQIEFKLAP